MADQDQDPIDWDIAGYAAEAGTTPTVRERPPPQKERGIQPHRSGPWLEENPPMHVLTALEESRNSQPTARNNAVAVRASSPEENRKIRDMLRVRESWDPNQPWPESQPETVGERWPKFKHRLAHWGMGPYNNPDLYEYYLNLDRRDVPTFMPGSTTSVLREVLESDAAAQQTEDRPLSKWVNRGKLGQGSYATVYLWERQFSDGGPPLYMAVKDTEKHTFWQDYNMEGALVRKLNELGCNNVITVLDWIYKPARPPAEALVRMCFELAEYKDLARLCQFYRNNGLVLPEAFIWHVFWSVANALCHCRHGTNQSRITRPGWDPIVHGDVKPGNILLTAPDPQINEAYPTVKLGDFGAAYTVSESLPKLRMWKSTHYYGTPGFMAPEVQTVDQENQFHFRPVPEDLQHGSHSDVYSLGIVMEKLMSLRWYAVTDMENNGITTSPFRFYSAELERLAAACRSESVQHRPDIYDVYRHTSIGREYYKRIASREREVVPDVGPPYHSDVLYKFSDRMKWKGSRGFRAIFSKVNRAPLLKTPDTGAAVTQVSAPAPALRPRSLPARPPPPTLEDSTVGQFHQ
ncbi:MAG: hypothetical protein Q9218_005012, partial [Villophora microphyllina]